MALQATGADGALALAVGLVAVFSVWPVVAMLARSLDGGPATAAARYGEVVGASLPLIGNSLFSGILASLLSCAIALAVAVMGAFGPKGLGAASRGAALLSMVSPPFLASLAYIQLFGRRGLITHGILGLSVDPYGWVGVVLMQGLFFCAVNVMLLSASLGRIDRRLMAAATDLGASGSRVFLDVVMPLIRPTLVACFLLTFVRSISDYGTPVVIGGAFETVASRIYVQLTGYSDLAGAAVLNVCLLACAVAVYWARRHLDAKAERLAAGTMDGGGGTPFTITGVPAGLLGIIAAAFAVFVGVLYLAILRCAFVRGMGWDAPFTLENFQHLVDFDLAPLGRGIVYAALAALIGCALGAAVAYFCRRRQMPGSSLFAFAAATPYMLPGTCLGLGYILSFNSEPLKLTGTGAIIVAVLVAKQLTVSVDAFSNALAQVPRDLDRAAADLGAGELSRFGDVLWPNLREAVAVSLLNGFSSAMMAYGAVVFLVAPRTKTGIVQLFDALASGRYGYAAAIAVVLITITLAVNAVCWRLAGRGRR
ncbi:iron ABC transporter permease [Olsenella sp. KGMB02461]|nr:iron ABC transporter permease [Olsenella sp. KGMB02461]